MYTYMCVTYIYIPLYRQYIYFLNIFPPNLRLSFFFFVVRVYIQSFETKPTAKGILVFILVHKRHIGVRCHGKGVDCLIRSLMFHFSNKNIRSLAILNCKNMSSESPRKKSRHVCLICGSYTTLMINIYEPRSGPNIVEVINQKFGMQVNIWDH